MDNYSHIDLAYVDFSNQFLCLYRYLSIAEPILKTSNRSLDRTMKKIIENKPIDESISKRLHFTQDNIGTLCLELDDIINIGIAGELITPAKENSKDYEYLVSRSTAESLVKSYPVDIIRPMYSFVNYILRQELILKVSEPPN